VLAARDPDLIGTAPRLMTLFDRIVPWLFERVQRALVEAEGELALRGLPRVSERYLVGDLLELEVDLHLHAEGTHALDLVGTRHRVEGDHRGRMHRLPRGREGAKRRRTGLWRRPAP
jgi:hypothetical protein